MLYIIATPIGNLKDITIRALDLFKACDTIVCEDTRHTKILLKEYQIDKPLISWHAQSSDKKLQEVIKRLQQGETLALVSDAGTPGISDPGYKLVQAAYANNIKVSPIPGPSAFLTALQGSGAPINQFVYLGFLPHKKGRQTLWKSLKEESRTIVFYESPHRLQKTLDQMLLTWDENRLIIIARELTKVYEEFLHVTIGEAIEHFKANKPRGEFVVIVPAV